MHATVVATPVLEHLSHLPSNWRVVGATGSTLYLVRNAFVIALTSPSVPRMPNGIALDELPICWPELGTAATCSLGSIRFANELVRWSEQADVRWDPSLSCLRRWGDAESLGARGRAILSACAVPCPPGVDAVALTDLVSTTGFGPARFDDGRRAIRQLLLALSERNADQAAHAGELLLGRGSGLTPEGDDLLCGAAAVVAGAGAAMGLNPGERAAWLAAVSPPAATARSSWLSVTLLRLACEGRVAQPVRRVLDPAEARWRVALHDLLDVGSSTGLAYALGVGSAAVLLAAGAPGR